jgi:hypothetical protein
MRTIAVNSRDITPFSGRMRVAMKGGISCKVQEDDNQPLAMAGRSLTSHERGEDHDTRSAFSLRTESTRKEGS